MHRQPHRRFLERFKYNDIFYATISNGYRFYLELRGRIHQSRQLRSLGKQFDVFDVIQIDPTDVSYKMPRWEEFHWVEAPGTIKDGEWDRELPEYRESDLYTSFRMHFVDDIRWTKTPYFERVCDEGGWHGCSSDAEVLNQLKGYDALYRDIERNGYKSQTQLRATGEQERRFSPVEYCEVLVNIGREGDIILDDGRHRFTIATLLGIDEIPACILVRHRDAVEYSFP